MMTGQTFLRLPLDTRSNRRIAVAATYASYVILCISAGLVQRGAGSAKNLIGLALLAIAGMALFAGWLSMVNLMREYGFPGDSRLFTSRDERQTGVRHRAFVRAYGILFAVICAGAVYGALAPGKGLWAISPEYRNQVLFGAIFFAATLPSAVVAWTEPDPIPHEQP
ncbi:MAG: hypothetical protein FJW30_15130 [Acidobacteria bacterium]|nr:hypothetical protein [Acidobacteriota bacterium]